MELISFSLLLAYPHCPIHGPQALVKILVDSNFSKVSINPSLSAVYLTCSDPGLIPKIALASSPLLQHLLQLMLL